MVAVREGHADVVRLLLDAGADVNAQTRAGAVPEFRSPSDNAGSKGVGIIRGGWPEHGMRAPVPGAKTPLLYATRRGDLAVTRLLVEAGAELERADADGVTPLLERDPEREHRGGARRARAAWSISPSRVTSSSAARTSTPRTGTARRRSGPPSTFATSTSTAPSATTASTAPPRSI